MSSAPTVSAFVHKGSWDETTRKHTAMKWMEKFTIEFDKRNFESQWYTSDCTLQKADGSPEVSGRDEYISHIKAIYGPLTEQFHEPYFISATETDDGWEMLGQAKLFANLPGKPAQGETKAKDLSGKSWDVGVPSAFHFWYKKEKDGPDGLAIKRTEIISDSAVPMKVMMGRGLIKASDLGL